MINECIVYWIHKPEELDIYNQGYVGITNDLQRRLKEHRRNGIFDPTKMIAEVFLQGKREYCVEQEILLRPESNIGINKAPGGSIPPDVTGIKRNEETRRKMSISNVGMKGKNHSIESKLKMSNSRKGKLGKPHTEETKQKLSKIRKGLRTGDKNPMFGKSHSFETKQKISMKRKQYYERIRNETTLRPSYVGSKHSQRRDDG